MTDDDFRKPGFDLIAWLQLHRVSAVPSAITNILAGFLIANQSWQPVFELLLLVASSSLLYMSGMVLNDWFDADVDSANRPTRPIPSGRITRSLAARQYLGLTSLGLIFAWFAGTKSLAVAILLVLAIIAYNVVFKRTKLAPAIMGLCRTLNILLGASSSSVIHASEFWGLPTLAWWIAISLGILVTGLTCFARNESQSNNRQPLIWSATLLVTGIVAYAASGYSVEYDFELTSSTRFRYVVIVGLVSFPIIRRLAAAIHSLQPALIQSAVITVLRSLIIFDAAVCFLVSQNQLIYPLVTLLFIVPSILLSKWISST